MLDLSNVVFPGCSLGNDENISGRSVTS